MQLLQRLSLVSGVLGQPASRSPSASGGSPEYPGAQSPSDEARMRLCTQGPLGQGGPSHGNGLAAGLPPTGRPPAHVPTLPLGRGAFCHLRPQLTNRDPEGLPRNQLEGGVLPPPHPAPLTATLLQCPLSAGESGWRRKCASLRAPRMPTALCKRASMGKSCPKALWPPCGHFSRPNLNWVRNPLLLQDPAKL